MQRRAAIKVSPMDENHQKNLLWPMADVCEANYEGSPSSLNLFQKKK